MHDNDNDNDNKRSTEIVDEALDAKKITVRKLAVKTHIKAAQSKCRYTISPD
jgi:hypothetical protein